MAIGSTIHKVALGITDVDRHYYHEHDLVVAQHPSETDRRFMVRLLIFAKNASESLGFTKGLSTTDEEPALWGKSRTNEINLWIELGQPNEKRIRKACGRAEHVMIFTYDFRKAKSWWEQTNKKVSRFTNLEVFHIESESLDHMVQRTMKIQCNIQDGEMYISDDNNHHLVSIKKWEL